MKNIFAIILAAAGLLVSCGKTQAPAEEAPAAGADHADWSRNAVIYEVNTRQYTNSGTFREFAGHLPRLHELGADILWFMPIHPISEENRKGELGSYYAVRDYKAVNPEFGTFEDFKAVVDSAHALGMKVIIDWVPNHTGCDNAWVTEHPEYYKLNEEGQMYGPFDWTDVYQLDYDKAGTRTAMIDAMKFWITEAGIDGFRCDVAGRVPVDFWNDARDSLQSAAGEHPIFMLAEATEPELVEHAFDMDYNWPMKDLFSEIAATQGQYTFAKEGEAPRTFPAKDAGAIDSLLALQAEQYPADAYLMNMTSNHDLNSWEGTEFERLGILAPGFAVLTYTLPGMPVIYTGQETGMNRALEFFKKDTAPEWEPRNEYFAFYQTLNGLKHSRAELANGSEGAELVKVDNGNPAIYSFTRTKDGKGTYVAVNLSAAEQSAAEGKTLLEGENLTDIFAPDSAAAIKTTLQPGEYQVITFDAPAN